MNVSILAILLWLVTLQVQASNDVYVCEGVNGVREYSNTPSGRACKKADLPKIVIVKPDVASVTDSVAIPPASLPQTLHQQDGKRQALTIQLRTAEQRLAALTQVYNNGAPERLGDERNYARYLARVATLEEEIRRAQQYVKKLKQELDR
jgi:hypothetical protein